jgi:hypothetical protein
MNLTTGQNEETSALAPLIIDLGKVKPKKIKQLKKSTGPLIAEIEDAIDETLERLGKDADGKEILPVVVIVQKKAKKRRPFALF